MAEWRRKYIREWIFFFFFWQSDDNAGGRLCMVMWIHRPLFSKGMDIFNMMTTSKEEWWFTDRLHFLPDSVLKTEFWKGWYIWNLNLMYLFLWVCVHMHVQVCSEGGGQCEMSFSPYFFLFLYLCFFIFTLTFLIILHTNYSSSLLPSSWACPLLHASTPQKGQGLP